MPPAVFVPLAEQCGLVGQLGRGAARGLHRGRGLARGRERRPLPSGAVAVVNVSAVQLASPGLVDDVRAALADSGLPSRALVLEITETAVVHEPQAAAARLAELRALGVRIALDDFGTGYAR